MEKLEYVEKMLSAQLHRHEVEIFHSRLKLHRFFRFQVYICKKILYFKHLITNFRKISLFKCFDYVSSRKVSGKTLHSSIERKID